MSGVPGTGKTATVLETMRSLRRKAEAGQLAPFQFVEINSLRLPSPQHAYTHLYEVRLLAAMAHAAYRHSVAAIKPPCDCLLMRLALPGGACMHTCLLTYLEAPSWPACLLIVLEIQ